MSDEISTSELTAAEIVYARASDALRVDADGFGFVKRDWLTKFREAVRERGMVNRVTNAIAEYDRTHPESLSYSTMAGIAIEVIGEQLARDLIAAQAEVAAWRSAYGSATGLGPQSPDEVAAFVREDDRVEREHSSHLNKQLIAAQQRIAELEDGQRADSGAECREFRYADRVAGIDKHGCYQVASDGTRCDADPVCVLKVAESQVRVLTARIAELERNRDEGMTMLQVRGEHLAAAEATIAELTRDRDLALQQVMDVERERDTAEATIARVVALPAKWKAYRDTCRCDRREGGVDMCEGELEEAITPPREVQGDPDASLKPGDKLHCGLTTEDFGRTTRPLLGVVVQVDREYSVVVRMCEGIRKGSDLLCMPFSDAMAGRRKYLLAGEVQGG